MSVFEAEIPFCQLLLYSILYFLGLLGILVLMGLIDKKKLGSVGNEVEDRNLTVERNEIFF